MQGKHIRTTGLTFSLLVLSVSVISSSLCCCPGLDLGGGGGREALSCSYVCLCLRFPARPCWGPAWSSPGTALCEKHRVAAGRGGMKLGHTAPAWLEEGSWRKGCRKSPLVKLGALSFPARVSQAASVTVWQGSVARSCLASATCSKAFLRKSVQPFGH